MVLASTGDAMDLATLADVADEVIEVAAPFVSAIPQPPAALRVISHNCKQTCPALPTSSPHSLVNVPRNDDTASPETAAPPPPTLSHPRLPSAGTTKRLGKLLRSTRSPATGKRLGWALAVTGISGPPQPSPSSRQFFICDTHMHTCFVVDTGSEVSAIPPTHADHRQTRPHGSEQHSHLYIRKTLSHSQPWA